MIDPETRCRVAGHFRRGMDSYDRAARVQKEVGEDLIARLAGYPRIGLRRVLEVGCGTGAVTEELCRGRRIDELWLNDLVGDCCGIAAARVAHLAGKIRPLPGDIEELSLPAGLDLIATSSTLQWLADLPAVFAGFAAALAVHGHLVFAMFGPGTMGQIRELTGVGLHYRSEAELRGMLGRHFRVLDAGTRRYRLFFQTPRDVLRHIRQTGVGGAGVLRWTPGRLKRFESDYRHRFGMQQGMPLDYVSTYVIAFKR
jgi:malonyl-ACP O-methyltransferase BioC